MKNVLFVAEQLFSMAYEAYKSQPTETNWVKFQLALLELKKIRGVK